MAKVGHVLYPTLIIYAAQISPSVNGSYPNDFKISLQSSAVMLTSKNILHTCTYGSSQFNVYLFKFKSLSAVSIAKFNATHNAIIARKPISLKPHIAYVTRLQPYVNNTFILMSLIFGWATPQQDWSEKYIRISPMRSCSKI